MTQQQTLLRPFAPDNIPAALRKQKRWAPWKAVWNKKRGKLDKLPCQANGYGLSTAQPERWYTFEHALAAQQAQPGLFAGIGYVMTGVHGIVGVDLDRCVDDAGVVSDQAQAIVDALGGYAERSPSGHGLRIMAHGGIPADWTNHDIGIEVYAGHAPRFLTITGDRLADAAPEVRPAPAGVLEGLTQRYARERTAATDISRALPELLDDLSLPDLGSLDLPYASKDFLADGTVTGDRSGLLFSTAIALYGNGLTDAEVFSVLANNEHAFAVALEHRREDPDRALMYLWVEHAQKAKGRGGSKVATLADFDDVSGGSGASGDGADKKPDGVMFDIIHASELSKRMPLNWILKGLLPHAELGAIFGASFAGKSYLAIDIAVAVARGIAWRGHKCKQAGVLYIAAEGARGVGDRLTAHSTYHGYDLASVDIMALADAPNLLDVVDVKGLVASIKARCTATTRLIFMDTLAAMTPGGNENSGEDMGRALNHCKLISKVTGCMVVLVAHSGKDGGKGLRGWSGIKAALDVEIEVERSGVHHAATVSKLKDGGKAGTEYPFGFVSVAVRTDEDGDEVEASVCVERGAVPMSQRKTEPKGAIQQLVLRIAEGLTDLPGEVTVHSLIDASVNELPKPEGKRDQRSSMVMRAVEALVGANRLSVTNGMVGVL